MDSLIQHISQSEREATHFLKFKSFDDFDGEMFLGASARNRRGVFNRARHPAGLFKSLLTAEQRLDCRENRRMSSAFLGGIAD